MPTFQTQILTNPNAGTVQMYGQALQRWSVSFSSTQYKFIILNNIKAKKHWYINVFWLSIIKYTTNLYEFILRSHRHIFLHSVRRTRCRKTSLCSFWFMVVCFVVLQKHHKHFFVVLLKPLFGVLQAPQRFYENALKALVSLCFSRILCINFTSYIL